MKWYITAAAALTLGGCGYANQVAQVQPQISVAVSTIGAGRTVALTVADERADPALGNKGSTEGLRGGRITLDQDLAAIVRDAIADGLRKKGFAVVASGPSDSSLRVDIRGLSYTYSAGLLTDSTQAAAALKATAKHGEETFDQFYRSSDEGRWLLPPSHGANDQRINAALNDALTKLVEDPSLLRVLSSR